MIDPLLEYLNVDLTPKAAFGSSSEPVLIR